MDDDGQLAPFIEENISFTIVNNIGIIDYICNSEIKLLFYNTTS